jgi:DNA-binding transcriptional LysR family regulator
VCKSRLGSPAEVLERGEVDLWFGVDPPEVSGVYAQKLKPDTFLCAVRKGHPVLKGGGPTLKQFAALEHVQIAPGERPGGPLDDLLAARGLSRTVAVRLPHFLVAPLLVAKTDLVLTAPARVLRAFAGLAKLHLFPPPVPIPAFTLHQVWHARHHADAGHKWFRERVREAMLESDGFVLGPARAARRPA